jgi:hypothetical protein
MEKTEKTDPKVSQDRKAQQDRKGLQGQQEKTDETEEMETPVVARVEDQEVEQEQL